MNLLSVQLMKYGFIEESMNLGLSAYEIKKEVLGEEHPLTISATVNIANIFAQNEEYNESYLFYDKALRL